MLQTYSPIWVLPSLFKIWKGKGEKHFQETPLTFDFFEIEVLVQKYNNKPFWYPLKKWSHKKIPCYAIVLWMIFFWRIWIKGIIPFDTFHFFWQKYFFRRKKERERVGKKTSWLNQDTSDIKY